MNGFSVKKSAHFQVTCMLLVSYLHFSRCSGAERIATLILFILYFFQTLFYIFDVFGNNLCVFCTVHTLYVYYE